MTYVIQIIPINKINAYIYTQAMKKGASQTVIGLIFGCYAVCNLIGSLILGKYVSIWHCFLLVHITCVNC